MRARLSMEFTPAWQALRQNPLLRAMGSMGAAQLAMRISRLLTTVILARSLAPSAFGMAAVVLTVYEFVALFTRNGISAMVVRAEDDDVAEIARTAHWLTWLVCLGLLVVQLLIALPVAWAFHNPALALPIALMGLIYLATPLCSMQCAFMLREGRVGRIAFATGLQVTADNLLTALLALAHCGMWAIVLPKLLVAPIWVIVTRSGHAWRISGKPSLAGAGAIARFSFNVVGVELMTTAQANIDNLIVGYFLGVDALGTYYFAFNAGLGISLGLIGAFSVAIYPHLCAAGAGRAELAQRFGSVRRTMARVMLPLILAQTLLAPIYVPMVFGAKWRHAVPVMMLICASALPRPFAAATSQLLKAMGRPEIELRWQVVLTLVLAVALLGAAQVSILAVAISVLAVQGVMLSAFSLVVPRAVLRAHARRAAPRLPEADPTLPREAATPPMAAARHEGDTAMHILLLGFEAGRWGTARLAAPLQRAGFSVAVLCPADNALAHSSFVAQHFLLENTRDARAVERTLAKTMRACSPTLVVPADEQAVACLHAIAARGLRGKGPLDAQAQAVLARSLGNPALYNAKLLKSETQVLARSLGVRVPAGRTVGTAAEAAEAASAIGGPVYVKSSFSWAGQGVQLCATPAEAAAALSRGRRSAPGLRRLIKRALHRDWYPTAPGVDVQAAIAGTPAMYCAVAIEGRIVAGFGGVALRTTGATGPSSIVRLGPHAEMAAASEKLCAAFGLTGFIGFDFMLEAATGRAYFLECNPRPIQVGHLASRLGTDLCGALACGLRRQEWERPTACREETLALFPQEWQRNPQGIGALEMFVDVPWEDRALLDFMTQWVGRQRGATALPPELARPVVQGFAPRAPALVAA